MIINNKEAKFFWGMIAFEVYQEAIIKAAKNRSNLTTFSVGSVSAILWGGILNHYERLFIECPFNYSEVYDYVEKAALSGEIDKGIEECIIAFNNSVAVQNASKVSEEDVKKKEISCEEIKLQAFKAGLTPHEYISSKPKDVFLMIKAYNERVVDLHEIGRRVAYFSAAPHVKNMPSMDKFWPLPSDEEARKERFNRLKERLKKESDKVNGNRANANKGNG